MNHPVHHWQLKIRVHFFVSWWKMVADHVDIVVRSSIYQRYPTVADCPIQLVGVEIDHLCHDWRHILHISGLITRIVDHPQQYVKRARCPEEGRISLPVLGGISYIGYCNYRFACWTGSLVDQQKYMWKKMTDHQGDTSLEQYWQVASGSKSSQIMLGFKIGRYFSVFPKRGSFYQPIKMAAFLFVPTSFEPHWEIPFMFSWNCTCFWSR